MANNDNIKWMYDQLTSRGANLGSIDDFSHAMADSANRKWAYDYGRNAGLNLGSEDDFAKAMGVTTAAVDAPEAVVPDNSASPAPNNSEVPLQQMEQPVENAPTFEVAGNGYTFTEDELQKMEEGQRPVLAPAYGSAEYASQKIEGDASNPYAGMTRQQAINAVGSKFFNEWYGKGYTPETTKEVDGEQVRYGGLGAYDQIRAELAANNIVAPEHYANVTKDIRRAYIQPVARRRVEQLMSNFKTASHQNIDDIQGFFNSREAQKTINEDLEHLGFAPTPEAYNGDEVAMQRDAQRYEQAKQYYYQQLQNELQNVLVDKYGWLPSSDARSDVGGFRNEILSGGGKEHEERIRDREAVSMTQGYLSDAIKNEIEEFDKKAKEASGKAYRENTEGSAVTVGTPGYTGFGALGAGLYAERKGNEERDPDKIIASLRQKSQVIANALHNNGEGEEDYDAELDWLRNSAGPLLKNVLDNEKFLDESKKKAESLGISPSEYIMRYVFPNFIDALEREFQSEMTKKYMPKNTMEYILGGLEDSLVGMLGSGYVHTESQQRYKNMANAQYGEDAGLLTNALRTTVGFVADAPMWAAWGRLGGAVAKRQMAEYMLREASRRGVSLQVMQRAMAESANHYLGAAVGQRLMQGVPQMAITMGGTQATSELARGIRDREELGEILKNTLGTAVTEGVKGGVIGTFTGVAHPYVDRLSGIGKVAGKAGSFAGEAGVFYTAGELEKLAKGEDAFGNPLEGLAESALNLALIKLTNMDNIKRYADAFLHPKKALEAKEGELTDEDVAIIRENADGAAFIDAITSLRPARTVPGAGEREGNLSAEEINAGAEAYRRMMTNPDIPFATKQRVARIVDGILPPPGKAVTVEVVDPADDAALEAQATNESKRTNDGYVLRTRDIDGQLLEERRYDSREEADEVADTMRGELFANSIEALEGKVNTTDAYRRFTQYFEDAYTKAAEKILRGEELTKAEQQAIYLHQHQDELLDIYKNVESGEELSEDGQSLADLYRQHFDGYVRSGRALKSFTDEYEREHGLEPGSLHKALEKDVRTEEEVQMLLDYQEAMRQHIAEARDGDRIAEEETKEAEEADAEDVTDQRMLENGASGNINPAGVVFENGGASSEGSGPGGSADIAGGEAGANGGTGANEPSAAPANAAPSGDAAGTSARREVAYQRGTAAAQDQSTLPQVNYDLMLSIARMEKLFPANDPVLSRLRSDVMKAVEAGNDTEADRLITANASLLNAQQREAIELYRDMEATQAGLGDAVTQQVQAFEQQRRAALEPLKAPDGSITELELADGSKAYYLAGNLNNTLGGVMVTTETGERKQIPVSQVKSVGTTQMIDDIVNAEVDAYGQQLEQQYEALANGGDFVPGSQTDLMVAGRPFRATVAGKDVRGNIVFTMEDGSQLPMSSRDARLAVYEADKAKIEAQLKQEAEAATLLQQRERFGKGIVGYAEGTPDLTAEGSEPTAVAEYLESTLADDPDGHAKLLSNVDGEIDRLRETASNARVRGGELAQHEVLMGLTDAERGEKERVNAEETEALRKRRKWGEIRQALMTDEERRKFEAERQKEISKAQTAVGRVQPAGEPAGTVAVPTGQELLEQFAEQGDAARHVEAMMQDMKTQYRDRLFPQLSSVRDAINDYRLGLTDVSEEDLRNMLQEQARLEVERSAMTVRQQELGKLASSLGRLYASRNKAAMTPHEQKIAAMEKESDPSKKIKLAREAYRDDEEALEMLDQGTLEPQDVYEWIAANLGKGSINWEGLQRGEHYVRGLIDWFGRDKKRGIGKQYDTNAINYFLAPEGQGKGIDEVVHAIAEGSPYDDTVVANALDEMLRSASKPTDITNRIVDDRIARADEVYEANLERERDAEEEARREAEDAAIIQMTGMTPDEYDAFMGDLEQRLAEQEGYRTSEEYFNQIAEDNDRENERRAGGSQEAGALAEQGQEGEPGAAAPAGEGGTGEADVDVEDDPYAEAVKAARNGDKDAQEKLKNLGLDWTKKTVYRFVAEGEVQAILNGETYNGRSGDGRVDVTASDTPTSAASAEYRITFNDDYDWALTGPEHLQMKNEKLGDGWLMNGYSLQDVAKIEKKNEDGSYTTVYEKGSKNLSSNDELSPSAVEEAKTASFPARLATAKAEVNTAPTDAQKEAGNYKKGHISFGGYEYTIENPKGSVRSGVDRSGKPWSTTMQDTYGYILGKYGHDGDHIDMFINDDADLDSWNGRVFVVDQKSEDGSFDEHKVMYGYNSWKEAKAAYERNYTPGWWDSHVLQMTGVKKADFDKWLEDSDHKRKPFADYVRTKNGDPIRDNVDQLISDVRERVRHLPTWDADEIEGMEPERLSQLLKKRQKDLSVSRYLLKAAGVEGSGSAKERLLNNNIVKAEADIKALEAEQRRRIELREIGDAMVDNLETMGFEVSTDPSENRRVRKQAEKDQSEEGKMRHFETSSGDIYGFTYRGKMYLDPTKIDAELPVHEYAHPWCEAFRRLNPEGWKSIVGLMKGDKDTWEFVKAVNPDLTSEDDIAEEMIAKFSGKKGAERAEAEYRRMNGKDTDYKSKWGNIWKNISKAIQDFWKQIGDFLHIKYASTEQVYDQVVRDFANKINPRKRVEEWLRERDERYMQAVGNSDISTAKELFDQALRENIGNGITPFVAVAGYRGKLQNLARGIKNRDPRVVSSVANLMAPLIPKDAVLVPAPSHNGTATDMLDLAQALSERTGAPVADVLRGGERGSQYEAKKAGRPLSVDDLGIKTTGKLPDGKLPVVIDNVVDTGITAEACVRALGKGIVISLADSADRYKHVASLKSAEPVVTDKTGKVVPLSKRFELGGRYLEKADAVNDMAMESDANDMAMDAAIVSMPRINQFGFNESDPIGRTLTGIKQANGEGTLAAYFDTNGKVFLFMGKDAGAVRRDAYTKGTLEMVNGVERLSVPETELDVVLPILVRKGYTVGIADKISEEQPQVKVRRSPVKSIVQGELFSDQDFEPVGAEAANTPRTRATDVTAMSDEELLKAIGENEEKERGFHIDEYDKRHRQEYAEVTGAYSQMLEENNTSLDDAYSMYADTKKQWADKGGYATPERTQLLAQIDALEAYIEQKEAERMEREAEEEEARLEQERQEAEQQYQQQKEEVRAKGYDLTQLKLRPLKPGETSHVERRYVENGMFSFTGGEYIESIDDVAFIFKELEDAAVENTFMVLEKDGVPTIIHLAIGSYDAAHAPVELSLAAFKAIEPDKVWFVHNHPSGNLKSSRQDRDLMRKFHDIFGYKLQDGIIIDTKSGKYGVFQEASDLARDMPSAKDGALPMKVYSFSKHVFAPDWNPDEAFRVTSAESIAEFVSSHRLGEHDKMSLIVLDQAGHVTGNVFLPWTTMADAATQQGADLIANYVQQMGGNRVVIYGNYLYKGTKDEKDSVRRLNNMLRSRNVRTQDIIHIDRSAYEMGDLVGEPTASEAHDAVDAMLDEVERRKSLAEKREADNILKQFFSTKPKDEESQARQRATQAVLKAMDKAGVPYEVVSKEQERKMLTVFAQMNQEAVKEFCRRPDIRAMAPHGSGRYAIYNVEDPFGVPMYAEKQSVARWIKQGVKKYGGKWEILDIGWGDEDATRPVVLKTAAEVDGEVVQFMLTGDNTSETATAPVFVSNALKAVEGIKQEKATPEQWLAMITKAGGLKAGEDKWLGLSDWLKERANTRATRPGESGKAVALTKQEVIDFIRENQIQVEDVNYGSANRAKQDEDYESLSVESLPEAMREPMRKLNERWKTLYQEARKDADSPTQARNAAFVQLREEYGSGFGTYFASRSAGQLVVRNPSYLQEAAKMLGVEVDIDNPINSTRLNYTTEGLQNKREIALVVPTIESWNRGDDIHFGDAGDGRAVAWVRFGDAYVPNMGGDPNDLASGVSKVLVIDEIQSKRHQEGREKGYKDLSAYTANLDDKTGHWFIYKNGEKVNEQYYREGQTAEQVAADYARQHEGGIPDAPFEKNWHELAMKRMLRYAAENGYDKIAWTKGEQQAERYHIGTVVRAIDAGIDQEGNRVMLIHLNQGGTVDITFDDNGNITHMNNVGKDAGLGEAKNISEIVGKEIAAGALSVQGKGTENMKTWKGDGLRIGGEGMKGFYDQMLPRFMDKYGKKWGVRTGEVELPDLEPSARKMWAVDVTPEMKASVMQGQPMFQKEGKKILGWSDSKGVHLTEAGLNPNTPIHECTHMWDRWCMKEQPELWKNLVAAMKKTAMWEQIRKDTNYRNIWEDEDRMASEVHSRLSGAVSEEEFMKAAFKKGTPQKIINEVKSVLRKFWEALLRLFGKQTKTNGNDWNSVEAMVRMPLRDLLNQDFEKVMRVVENYADGMVEGSIVTDNAKEADQTKAIFDQSKKLFGTTYDIREAGYVLPDGSMLDFSGRHEMDPGSDTSFLRGRRSTDHREIKMIAYERDGNTETGIRTDMPDFIRRGAIRIDNNAGSIILSVKPTAKQKTALRQLIARNDGYVQVDFGDGWNSDHYVEYDGAKPARVLADIDRYFDEGIKPQGDFGVMPRLGAARVEKVNTQFNEDLAKYQKGTLPTGYRFELGMPSVSLLSAGFPNLPISMRSSLLARKAGDDSHPFDASELRDLVKAMQRPIAIFKYSKDNMRNLIVDVMHNDKHFLVGVTLNYKNNGIEINSVSGLFPKESHEWIKWITDPGKAIRIDGKEKIQDIIDSLRTNPAESVRIGLNLNSAAKIVKDFENPKLLDEKIREIYPEYTDAGDEMAEQLGGVKVIWEQQTLEPGTKGWYDPNNNTVHVAIDEVEDADDVQRTVCHEKLGHEGLVALFTPGGGGRGEYAAHPTVEAGGDHAARPVGQDEVNKFGTFIFKSASKKLRQRILEKADEEGYGWNDPLRLSKAAQEVFADIAADGPATADEFSLWDKVKHYLIRMANKIGLKVRGLLNDHDLRYYVLKTGEALKRWNRMDGTARQNLAAQSTRYDIMRSRRGKPRKKNNESMSQYLQRLREWEKWKIAEETAEANGDPMPDKESIDKRYEQQFNADLEAWREANGLPAEETNTTAGPGEFPKRGENESPQEYAIRVAEYETKADMWKTAPDYFDYIQKAQEEYRRLYEEWKRRYDLQEEDNVDLALYEGEGGEGPQTFTDEEAELRAEQDMAEAFGVQVDADGARRHAKLAVIERRKNLESSNAEDAIWLHDLMKKTEELAATMSEQSGQKVTGKMLREALPFIIEGTYWEEALIDQDGNVVGYADISDQVPIKRSPELDALLADIKEWYDRFFFALEEAGLRGEAGYIGEGYVNHIWDKGKSDPKAWEEYVENYQRTKSPNMKHREVDTYQQGIDIGLVPKFKDIADILAYYSRSNNEALANKKFLDDLSFMVVEELNSDGEVVSVLPMLSSVKPDAFTYDRYVMYHVPGVGDVWVIKDIQKRFANVFGTMRTHDVNKWLETTGKLWDITGSTAKKIELALSGFHALALWEVDIAQNGPVAGLMDLFKYVVTDSAMKGTLPAYAHPEDFKFAASHLVQLGATEDYAAADVNNITGKLREMVMELYHSDNAFKKAAGVTGSVPAILLDWVNKGFDTVLWNYLHDGLKIASMMRFKRQIDRRAEREGLSDEQREKLYDEAGQYVNDMFGGQFFELLNVSPGTLKWMRRLLLSPDWLISTNRHFFANFGFGSLYSDGGWQEYLRYNWNNIKRAAGSKIERDELRRFRSRNSKLCYLIGVLFFWNVFYNALNAINRKRDEEKQKELADEIRKQNPDYKSPYELAYPDGMKWYDYTMLGNSLGQQTHLFTGRYEDGTETYVRWGKQFREFPELFIGRHGLEFPAPLIERMKAKANPNIGGVMDFLGALGVRGFEEGYENRELREKYGRTISVLSATARHFIPFGIPTQADKEYKVMDFFMPSSKGFSRYKTVDYFKTFIIDGDMRGIEQTFQAAVMNGVDAEECLKAAIASVKAEQRKELVDGVTDLTGASERFDAATTYKDRSFWKKKMEQYLGGENHQAMQRAAFMENVQRMLDGESADKNWSVATESYLMRATRDDIIEDYRVRVIAKQVSEMKRELEALKNSDVDETYVDEYRKRPSVQRLLKADKIMGKYKRSKKKAAPGYDALRNKMGGSDDASLMQQIRDKRHEMLTVIDALPLQDE